MSENKLPRALVLFSSKEDSNLFQDTLNEHEALKNKMKDVEKITTLYDSFQSGSKKDRFSFVIAFAPAADAGDNIEMQEEFYQNYSVAPVFAWVANSAAQEACGAVTKNAEFIECAESDKTNIGDALVKAVDWALNKLQQVTKDEVEPSFQKVDTDGSGAIDKSELGTLSANLGQPLNEE